MSLRLYLKAISKVEKLEAKLINCKLSKEEKQEIKRDLKRIKDVLNTLNNPKGFL